MIAALPERPEGHFALGLACLGENRYLEALDAFHAAQLRDPNFEPVLYNIGYTYLKLDQPELAISWLERALRRGPKNLATMHQLGIACERLDRREEAVHWWKRALEIDPNYSPAQWRLHEISEGPEPVKPLSPNQPKLRLMTPEIKARMRKPQVYCSDGVTLTFDGRVGFVLEDADNPLNGTIHAGSPFTTAIILDEDLLDLMGLVKMLLRMIDANNTRDIAILVYYTKGEPFNYQTRFQRGKRIEFDAQGQFVVTELPLFFKLCIDSDLVTPYGNPMHGMLIYLNQHPKSSILISTLGLKHGG